MTENDQTVFWKFREECSRLQKEVVRLQQQFESLDKPEDKRLVELLFEALRNERLATGTWLHKFLMIQLEFLNKVCASCLPLNAQCAYPFKHFALKQRKMLEASDGTL